MTAQTVWLASYPKSGNTWVRALLTALMLDDGELDINCLGHGAIASARGHVERWSGLVASDLAPEEIGWLRPRADLALNATLERPRYRKIHDGLFTGPGSEPIVAPDATKAAVYIVRDPRDVAVSFAHHAGKPVKWAVERMGDADTTFARTIKTIGPQVRQRLGSWSEHVESWIDQNHFPVVVVRYEDLDVDPARELTRIAVLGDLDIDPKKIDAAVDAAAFDRLRSQESRDGFRERPQHHAAFFRRGRTGGWREELAPELAGRVTEDHERVMARLGYL